MKGVSSGCSLPLDQPQLTSSCLRVVPFVRLRHGSLSRALRGNRLRRFPRVGRPLRPMLARG
eukprot:scaffold3933_cov98-Cylindrotheca_fusiformis.AAC.1